MSSSAKIYCCSTFQQPFIVCLWSFVGKKKMVIATFPEKASRLTEFQRGYITLNNATLHFPIVLWHWLNIARLRNPLAYVIAMEWCPFLTPGDWECALSACGQRRRLPVVTSSALLLRRRQRELRESLWVSVNERVDISNERRRRNWHLHVTPKVVRDGESIWSDFVHIHIRAYVYICTHMHKHMHACLRTVNVFI